MTGDIRNVRILAIDDSQEPLGGPDPKTRALEAKTFDAETVEELVAISPEAPIQLSERFGEVPGQDQLRIINAGLGPGEANDENCSERRHERERPFDVDEPAWIVARGSSPTYDPDADRTLFLQRETEVRVSGATLCANRRRSDVDSTRSDGLVGSPD